MNTTQIGDITEHRFILKCLELEIPVLKPVGNNLPYDFVKDYSGKLSKVQVKTSRRGKSKDVIVFNTRSTSKNYSEVVEKDYRGLIDFFATCFENKFYLLPIEDCSKSVQSLYIGLKPRTGQIIASKYLI